jgi:hypothetical protein
VTVVNQLMYLCGYPVVVVITCRVQRTEFFQGTQIGGIDKENAFRTVTLQQVTDTLCRMQNAIFGPATFLTQKELVVESEN